MISIAHSKKSNNRKLPPRPRANRPSIEQPARFQEARCLPTAQPDAIGLNRDESHALDFIAHGHQNPIDVRGTLIRIGAA